MKFRVLLLISAVVALSTLGFGQDLPLGTAQGSAMTMGPGDEITVKVLGEPQFDFVTSVDEEGNIEVPFVKEHLVAKCRTERDLRNDVTKKLSVYLRDPQVNLRVTDRKSRPPVSVYGEVVMPQQVTLGRKATLREVLAFAGGAKERSSGMVQVYRTRAPLCSAPDEAEWKSTGDGNIPSRFYSVSSIQKGGDDSNPQIFPGDLARR